MARRYKRRRGVVILVVLSMLVLFVLLAVTFAIISGQYRRAAEAVVRQELLRVEPKKDLDRAFYQILRDTHQRSSVARFHSILRDFYGEDGISGSLIVDQNVLEDWNVNASGANLTAGGAAYNVSGGQFLDLVVNPGAGYRGSDGQALWPDSSPVTLSSQPGYYNGCVLSMTSGAARGWSTMVVGFFYHPTSSLPVLRVLNLQTDNGLSLNWGNLAGASFMINGRPFNGTGFGFEYATDSSTGTPVVNAKTSAQDSVYGQPLALLPNHAARGQTAIITNNDFHRLLRGGADEGYDAVDYQNMFMAMVSPGAAASNDIIPSFHRPALINYWMNQTNPVTSAAYWADDDFKRLVSMRPVESDFDGSNPNFNYVTGPWDVDNDGDGIADSVWIDLGLPVQTAPDGRKYKPLFAILCTDMDGRLNVNAHGNPVETYANRPTPIAIAAGNTSASNWPNGLGYSPGEIQLNSITGNLIGLMAGRYGADSSPGYAGLDPLARIKFFEEPSNYFASTWPLSSYSTPPDLRGELGMGMDLFGQLITEQVPTTVTEARADSPGEISLVVRNNADTPYTPAELERVLRRFDLDSSQLPIRLASLVNTSGVDARLITTDSFDPPIPGVTILNDLTDEFAASAYGAHYQPKSLVELYRARGANNTTLKQLMPSELLLGQRMDLNRPLGSGRDREEETDRNGLVDEIGEQADEKIWRDVDAPTFPTADPYVPVYHTNGTDVNNDGTLTVLDHMLARQLLARHLYALVMALKDKDYLLDTDGDGAPTDAETARVIAQWAVNVVDYRDADSIMTAFEYDETPFNGWSPDGDITTPGDRSGVVWGCEKPELLITETLAFHDRRTVDGDEDDGTPPGTTTDPDPMKTDDDYDQQYLPRGAFFVELFNPSTSGTNQKAEEFYDSDDGVQINKVVSDGTTTSPVWRLVFYRDNGRGNDPDHPDATRRPTPAGETDEMRLVYFVDPTSGASLPAPVGSEAFGTTLPVSQILPGRYAVVGSKGIKDGNQYISPVGRTTAATHPAASLTDLDMANTRRIVLSPNAGGNEVHVNSNGLATPSPDDPADPANPGTIANFPGTVPPGEPADADILPATAIVIDTPRSLSISDPIGGYTMPPANPWVDPTAAGVVEGYFASPGYPDTPFDTGRYGGDLMTDQTKTWGTVHLQRLASPLVPYSSTSNPYRTVDSLRVDITAFNGFDADSDGTPAQEIRLFSVQRGDRVGNRQFWPQEPTNDPTNSTIVADPSLTHRFNYYLRSSLGYLNHGHWPYLGAAEGDYRGAPAVDPTDGFTQNDYTFSCLTWNNRPFVSQYELMQVPQTRSSKLLDTYTASPNGTTPYDPTTNSPQYRHLANFFLSSSTTQRDQSAHLYRLLEYIHVPSRFVGTDTVLNPQNFANHEITPGTPNRVSNPSTLNPSFLTPFNRISRNRDPGKVNINTIFDVQVWNALYGGYAAPTYGQMVYSRRGFAGANTSLLPALDARFPTFFANPFRPPGHGTLAPLSRLEREDIETTLLRSNVVPPDPSSATGDAPRPSSFPLLQGGVVNANTTATHGRNAFFRYNALRRLGNMVTTRSNVYAIWLTVGYFECDPNTDSTGAVIADAVHPDGYRVGQELGIATGEVQRHRAFYMIDRTIPVAFEPGENHNVDRCVLVRRVIE